MGITRKERKKYVYTSSHKHRKRKNCTLLCLSLSEKKKKVYGLAQRLLAFARGFYMYVIKKVCNYT